jgi:hypothetical protein
MEKTIDFVSWEKRAKTMSVEGLRWSIDDCRECIRLGIEPLKYTDQISVFSRELNRRANRTHKNYNNRG